MKLNFKAILFAAMTAFMSVSCVDGLEIARPELQDVDATSVELTTLVSSDAARVRPYNVYTLKLSSADGGIVLDAKFATDGQPLHSAVFTAATGDVRKNNYLTGANGTTLTIGGITYPVADGKLKVTLEGGVYALSGVVSVKPEDAAPAYYDLSWAGEAIKFKELPTKTTLTKVLSAKSNVASGTKTVTVQLATDGFTKEFDMTAFKDVYKGKGAYLAADFYTEDGYLAAGTYKPSADPQNPKAGEYVIGWDPGDLWNIGIAFENWGTCWWTVDNADPVGQKITAGEIYVSLDEESKEYTIEIDNGVQFAKFVGTIPAVTKPDPVEPDVNFDGAILVGIGGWIDYSMFGMNMLGIDFYTDGCTVSNSWWNYTYTGSGNHLKLELYAEGGVVAPGEYEIVAVSDAPKAFQVKAGDASGGSEWGTITDGARASAEKITDGTLTVEQNGGNYIVTIESSVCKARYVGPLAAPAQ